MIYPSKIYTTPNREETWCHLREQCFENFTAKTKTLHQRLLVILGIYYLCLYEESATGHNVCEEETYASSSS